MKQVLRAILAILLIIADNIRKGLLAFWHLFDRFRGTQQSTIVVNSLLTGLVLCLALAIFFALLPGIRCGRAIDVAASGDIAAFEQAVTDLRLDGYPEEKLFDARCRAAEKLCKAGKYEASLSLVANCERTERVASIITQCNYGVADDLYKAGSYRQAADQFYALGDHADSASRYQDCRLAMAIMAYQNGDTNAIAGYIVDVSDIADRVTRVARDVTGDADAARVLLESDSFSPQALADYHDLLESVSAARESAVTGRVAAGARHSVALKNDGTCIYSGDNTLGQCDVTGWQDITAIAAGDYHTLGLRRDGTVIACGTNAQGQCNVSDWRDIVAIAASSYDSYGLKSDGTVVTCGMHASLAPSLRDVTAMRAGGYSYAMLLKNGSVLYSHESAAIPGEAAFTDLDICGCVSCGVLYDGTMVSNLENAPKWTGVVSVCVTQNYVIAVDADGNGRYWSYREGERTVLGIGRIVEAAASGTHALLLTEDGKVYAFGDDTYGQCVISGRSVN